MANNRKQSVVGDLENELESSTEVRGMTRRHWRAAADVGRCGNRACALTFSVLQRKHHCRKCGEVFCKKCVSHCRRRLNKLAQPDPQGKLYSVCEACFSETGQELGGTRDLFRTGFAQYRAEYHSWLRRREERGGKRRFNLSREVERLRQGFRASTHRPRPSFTRALSDVTSLGSVPDWQKGTRWPTEELVTQCRQCQTAFSLVLKRHHCRVCASAVCASSCSSRDLLVYFEDDLDLDNNGNDLDSGDRPEASLCIIKVVGCPGKEPKKCVYLRVCHSCQEAIGNEQVSKQEEMQKEGSAALRRDVWGELGACSAAVLQRREAVEKQLPKYVELVDSLEISEGAPRSTPGGRSHVTVLAKAQSDLSDHMSGVHVLTQRLKAIKTHTPHQLSVKKNMIKSCVELYTESMQQFREARARLDATIPVDVLDKVQHEVDTNTVNSAYASTKQLVYEVIHLTTRHKFESPVLQLLMQAQEALSADLEALVTSSGEAWEEHEALVDRLVEHSITTCRFIKPSRRLVAEQGSVHVQHVMVRRCLDTVSKVRAEVEVKAAEKSAQASRPVLREVYSALSGLAAQY